MENLTSAESKEKATFMAILNFAAALDGITEDEQSFMDDIAADFEATAEELAVAKEARDEAAVLALLSNITDESTKKKLLRELFFLGYADGNLSDEEVVFISKVGNALGMPDELIERISEWVIRGIEWQEEGEDLF